MELNYNHEAENQMFFRKELHSRFRTHNHSNNSSDEKSSIGFLLQICRRRSKKIEKVIVPKVYKQYTTQRILVTEWIDGIPLAQAPPEQIRELIPVGVELFLCQLLDIGKFHADPHPGGSLLFFLILSSRLVTIIAKCSYLLKLFSTVSRDCKGNLYVTTSKVDGVSPTLCLLDFGLIANVDEKARCSMTHAIVNLIQGDYDTLIAHDAKQLGFLPHEMDVTELQPLLKTILKDGLVESGSNLHDRRRNLMAISKELNEVFFRYPFSVPPFFALVTRGLGLLEGIALSGYVKLVEWNRSLLYLISKCLSNTRIFTVLCI